MVYNETAYNTTILTNNINNHGYFVGVFRTMNTAEYTNSLFQYVFLILIFVFFLYVLRQQKINAMKAINLSLMITTVLAVLLMIMGAVHSSTIVILILLLAVSVLYQKLSGN